MQIKAAVLSFCTYKNCFVALPLKWTQGLPTIIGQVIVIKLQSSSGAHIHVSWSGETTTVTQSGEDVLTISGLLATKSGLKHGDAVVATFITDVLSCERISLQPLSVDEWEILELNASAVESELLSQIRVVAPDQVFPIWLHQTICIYVKIRAVGSAAPCVLLVEQTEVLVSPRVRTSRHASTSAIQSAVSVATPTPATSIFASCQRFLSNLYSRDSSEQTKPLESPEHSNCYIPDTSVWSLRVQSYVESGARECFCTTQQPNNVLVYEGTLGHDIGPGHFIAEFTKMTIPGSSTPSRGKLDGGDKTGDGVGEEQDRVVVRIVVVRECGCATERALLPGHVMVPDGLRQRLALGVTGCVRMRPIQTRPLPLTPLCLAPVVLLSEFMTPEKITLAFKHWVKMSTRKLPMVLSQGSLVKLFLTSDEAGEFQVNFSTPSSQSTDLQYFMLSKSSVEDLKVTVADPTTNPTPCYLSIDQLDPVLPNVQLAQIGGLQCIFTQVMQFLQLRLGSTQLTANLSDASSWALLLCGARGSGKTHLVQAVVTQLAQLPTLAHVAQVDCKRLKGKRLDSLKQLFEKIFTEARWRSPSIIILDDLDVLINNSGQEAVAENVYNRRIAEVLRDIIEEYGSSSICVLATTASILSIHLSIVQGEGRHTFREVISIKPLSASQRLDVLHCIIANNKSVSLSCLENCVICDSSDENGDECSSFRHLDLHAIVAKTEGFVARDLERLTERAVCQHLMLQSGFNDKEVLLSTSDYESALTGFTPTALRDVPLHQAGQIGWSDVGGLEGVKQTLIETLKWPSKYPKLFASCPLRLRSGLLLYGAPGTGKTLLAGVIAHECGLNFISIKGPELLNKYIGASEQAVRETFTRAQSARPSIIFFDEFDALAPRRGHDSTGVTDRVVNQLLTELDGVENLEGVYVLAASSRPDLIDPALLRPGRLDKALHCQLPTEADRLEILNLMTAPLELSVDVNLLQLATICEHFTGADLKALLYNAQVAAIHDDPSFQSHHGEHEVATSQERVGPPLIHIQKLEDGVQEPSAEMEQRLLREALSGEVSTSPGPTVQQTEVKASVITSQHLLTAANSMTPSVSSRERDKYSRIYNNFMSRSTSARAESAPMVKRATLA